MLTMVGIPISLHCCIPCRASSLPPGTWFCLWVLYYLKIWNNITGNSIIFFCSHVLLLSAHSVPCLYIQMEINHTNILTSHSLLSTLFRNTDLIVFLFIKKSITLTHGGWRRGDQVPLRTVLSCAWSTSRIKFSKSSFCSRGKTLSMDSMCMFL